MKKILVLGFSLLFVISVQAQMTNKEAYEPQKIDYIINNVISKFQMWYIEESNICMFAQNHVDFCDHRFTSVTLGVYTDCFRTSGIHYRDVRGIIQNINKINKKDWYRCESGMCVGRYSDGDFFVLISPEVSKFKNRVPKDKFFDVCKKIDAVQRAIENQ